MDRLLSIWLDCEDGRAHGWARAGHLVRTSLSSPMDLPYARCQLGRRVSQRRPRGTWLSAPDAISTAVRVGYVLPARRQPYSHVADGGQATKKFGRGISFLGIPAPPRSSALSNLRSHLLCVLTRYESGRSDSARAVAKASDREFSRATCFTF